MARLAPLQTRFDRGMRQDEPRNVMVKGALWNLVDYLIGRGAPLRKRGGWLYASPDLSTVKGTASYVNWAAYVPFATGAKLMVGDEDGVLYQVASSASAATAGSGSVGVSLQQPIFHAEKLIIPHNDGTTSPYYYDGSTSASLAGTPPAAKYAAVYKDRTVLANTSAQPRRAYFSGAGDPTSWDTTNSYWSFSAPIRGLAALPNSLLVFMDTQTARLRGSTPPPGSDFISDDPLFNVGCTDARSIVVTGAYAYFANPLGIYRTIGTSIPEDLTLAVGLKRYWTDLMASYSSSWTLAGGLIGPYYVLAVLNGSTFQDCLLIHTERLTAVRISNTKAVCFASAVTIGEKLYAGLRSTPRLIELSSIFSPTAAVKNDADGTAVAPILETAYFQGDAGGSRRWRGIFVSYDMRDAATDNPTQTVSVVKNPEDAYTALSPPLAETTDYKDPARLPLNFRSSGIAAKLAQTNASTDTRIYAIQADGHPQESSRRTP